MEISTRDLTLVTMFAALYAALVYVFAPISFMALQFRVAGVIRPIIAKKWTLAMGYGLGAVVGNLFSPFAGPWDLLFMPMMSVVAGVLGYVVSKNFGQNYFVCGVVIATVISFSVAFMLMQFGTPFIASFPYLLIAEQIVCLIGSVIFKLVEVRYKWWETN